MLSEIRKNLGESCPWQDSLIWFDSIESTNSHAKLLAQTGAAQGTVLIADHQTGGRGRLGRSFHSPAGSGIYMSVVLRPNCMPDRLMHLTCAAAVALCDAVEDAAGFRPAIKWTNDLVCGGKKIAGILTELVFSPRGTVDAAIIGIGVNCCQAVSDFPEDIRQIAGSLFSVSGKQVNRAHVAAAMIRHLHQMSETLFLEKDGILRRYRNDCITLGKEISIVSADGAVRHGTALDLEENGALKVRLSTGEAITVDSGEVSVRGMYGYL